VRPAAMTRSNRTACHVSDSNQEVRAPPCRRLRSAWLDQVSMINVAFNVGQRSAFYTPAQRRTAMLRSRRNAFSSETACSLK